MCGEPGGLFPDASAGSGRVIHHVPEEKAGETTPDGKFSYQPVECLASCHTGPCMQVNDEYHENLTPSSTEKLIEDLKKR